MKNVSNEFKNIIKSGGPFYAYASITLKNGEKLVLDSDNDFFISGNGYTEDGGDGFPLGSALSKSVTLVIDNIDERYSKCDFYYAQFSLFTEADMENRSFDAWRDVKGEEILDVDGSTVMLMESRIERLNEGTYTVLEPTAVGDTIEIVGYDAMYKADVDFTSKLSYPTTAGQLLREACSECGIMLGSPKFKNDDFVIEQAPDKVTCREVIGYIAMLAVGNAVIQDGTLVIKSYDFSAISKIASRADLVEDAGYSILMDYQSDPDISTDPVVITGIATTKKVENESTILIRGTDDYALEITNPLIEGHEDDAINLIGDVLIGVKLRGFSGEFFPDPTIEFMDLTCVVDRKDKVYPTFITSLEFNYLGSSSFSCGIKDPERQKSTYYSEATKVYEKAKKEIKQNKTEFEAAVENLNKTLENASGMYSTESPQPDGSMITYIHDKPTVEESKNVIKVTSEAIGISSDGGKTYPYGLFLTGDLITRILYAIGINADYINSGSLTVKDKNGNITFYADTETGRVTINAESISITGKSVEDISNGIVNDFVTNIYKTDMDEIKNSVRNKIETWFYDHEPSLQNEPAVNWTTNEQRKDHEGDLFFWKSTGYSYRFLQDGAVWKWQIVQDTDISKALAAAEKAQDTADHKRRVFVVTPQPPYDIGDLWVQGDDGDIMRCCVARSESASFSASDWEKASKYTDDTRANEVQKELETVNKDLQNQIDGKIETYNQSADPAASWTTAELKAKHTGDLWYNSKTEETMRWNGSAWSKLSDADAKAAKNLAVTKKRVFSVTPYPPYDTDDLWVQGTNGDLMRCVTSRQSGEYVASDWVKATKYTDDSAINNFVKNTYAADLENIKNQIDQKIETWFQPTDPSLNWTGKETQPLCDINGNDILDVSGKNITITVETEKATHEGDLWKNSKTGDEYIYRSGNWEKMPVPDSVFDEIDGKAQIFSTQPKPPYSVDDLYFTGNDILVCLKDRETGEYVASDWQKKDNYTDDSTVTDFIENIYDPKIEDIQNQIDGKIDTYYCDYEPANSNHPASEWTTAYERQKHVGDLFFWKNKGFTYRYMKVDTSYQWVRVKDADIVSAMETASKAQDTADGKRRNFITTPVPPYDVGDLWTQGDTGDLMRCKTARASGNYVSSDWTKATKYTDDSAVEKLNKSLTSEEVFNRLTDNGKKQGIYMQGDQLYINFSYGKGGTLTLGGVNNENGSIQILDAIGAEVGKWDKDGLNIKKGSIYGSTIYLDKEKAYALIVGRNNSKEIFTIGSMGMHIDNTNMGLLASDSMVVDLMGGWFHGLRMKASNNGRGYGSSISPECFSIGWAEDLQGWSDAMSEVKSYTFSISENSTGCLSIRINGSSYINDYVDISPREIKTTGTKNRVVPTENYSNRLQYCYETASPMFGDIGEGITDENGECIVEIGDIFTETVTTRIEYQVFLQKEGKGDLWIEKKEENYFIVHGTPNLKFAWELKAKQKDYEYVNLEEDVDREEKLPESPENILNAELETLIKEQEELLNETA